MDKLRNEVRVMILPLISTLDNMRKILHWVLFPITLPMAIIFWWWMFATGDFYDRELKKKQDDKKRKIK